MNEETTHTNADLTHLTMAELESLLNTRRKDVIKLERKRERLVQQLADVDTQIQELQGLSGGGTTAPGTPRPRNEKPLHVVVREILGRYKKGLPLAKLSEKVLEQGYKTQSSNFNNTVYQCIYKLLKSGEVEKDESSGNYMLQS